MSERMTARKRQALEMRSRIQSAALDLFDREGFENVSVEEIAQTAGCSVGNIYHYFTNKDEIFRTILKPVLNELYAKIYSHDANQMTIDVFISCLLYTSDAADE